MLHMRCCPSRSTASTGHCCRRHININRNRPYGISSLFHRHHHHGTPIGTLFVVVILLHIILLPTTTAPNPIRCNVVVQAWTITTTIHRWRWRRQQHHRLPHSPQLVPPPIRSVVVMMAKATSDDNNRNTDTRDGTIEEEDDDDDDADNIEATESTTIPAMSDDDDNNDDSIYRKQMERVWRYHKKPLLSIGAQKGPTYKHGNSLRELLQHHTAVKVKVQLLLYQSSSASPSDTTTTSRSSSNIRDQMIQVYEQLKAYTVQSDPSLADMELLQVRGNERILLVGLPGTTRQIRNGTYPPPPPPPNVKDDPTTTITTRI